MNLLQEVSVELSFPATVPWSRDNGLSLFAVAATMNLISNQAALTRKVGKHMLDDAILVCPIEHKPIYYGRCPDCNDWFTIKKNGNLRTHKDCISRHPYHDAPSPEAYAVICVYHRHLLGKQKLR